MTTNSPGQRAVKNIELALFLNVSFTIIEIIGSFLTNSLIILSDALHDFGGSLSLPSPDRLKLKPKRQLIKSAP